MKLRRSGRETDLYIVPGDHGSYFVAPDSCTRFLNGFGGEGYPDQEAIDKQVKPAGERNTFHLQPEERQMLESFGDDGRFLIKILDSLA